MAFPVGDTSTKRTSKPNKTGSKGLIGEAQTFISENIPPNVLRIAAMAFIIALMLLLLPSFWAGSAPASGASSGGSSEDLLNAIAQASMNENSSIEADEGSGRITLSLGSDRDQIQEKTVNANPLLDAKDASPNSKEPTGPDGPVLADGIEAANNTEQGAEGYIKQPVESPEFQDKEQVNAKEPDSTSTSDAPEISAAADAGGDSSWIPGNGQPVTTTQKPQRGDETDIEATRSHEKKDEGAKEEQSQAARAAAASSSAPTVETVAEDKMKWYMKAVEDLIPEVQSVLSYATEKKNSQLKSNSKVVLDRAEDLKKAWDAKGASGGWGGEERVMGVIKLMEQIRARGQEWRNTLKELERYKEQFEKMKKKMDEVSRERNGLDLAVAKGLPKALFCFNLKLTQAFAADPSLKQLTEQRHADEQTKYSDPELNHYALFSDNVLAAAVVVNSTVQNLENPEKHVIHLVTDALNLPAMQAWFALHPPVKNAVEGADGDLSKRRAALEIHTVESFAFLNASYCPVLKQLQASNLKTYYFSAHDTGSKKQKKGAGGASDVAGPSQLKFKNPKYLSMLNHLRFYLPEMFPNIHRVVFLDDDIVVQKDLTPLFSLPLHGNVNGAVFTCSENSTFHRLQHYLNFSHPFIQAHFHPDACGWAYGMNVFDLDAWRVKELTKVYHDYQTRNEERTLWKLGTLPPGLMTFYNQTEALDPSWHVLGLGYNREIPLKDATAAAVVHFNGNWKPWLDTALRHFKGFWTEYAAHDDDMIQQCNIDLN